MPAFPYHNIKEGLFSLGDQTIGIVLIGTLQMLIFTAVGLQIQRNMGRRITNPTERVP